MDKKPAHLARVATTVDTFRELGLYEGQEMLDESKRIGSLAGFMEVFDESAIDWTPLPLFRAWAGARWHHHL